MVYLELALPKQQRTWGWPAVVNLTLGGSGAGLYLLGFFFSLWAQPWPVESQLISFQILAPIIVCIGFISLTIEAGKPLRAYRLFSNLTGSWMAVESLAGAIFVFMAVISWLFPFSIFNVLAVITAFILILSQGLMVYRAAGVKAWNQKLIPALFVTSGMMTACGFYLLNIRGHAVLTRLPQSIFLFIIFSNLLFWLFYLFGRRDNDSKQTVKFLRRPLFLILTVVVGHIIPFAHFFFLFLFARAENALLSSAVMGSMTGLILVGCGTAQKAGIVMTAGAFRGLVLKDDPGL